jgi:predicted amidohydrolase YtcJ
MSFVAPAGARLREAHAHIPSHGRALTMLKLDECRSAEECLELLAGEARRTRGWVLACGARVEGWTEPRWPTRAELDRVTSRPCCVMSFDHHAVAANSAAMREGGIGERGGDPEGGVVVRDGDGEPTGLLLESAAWRVWSAAPEPSEAERRGQVLAAAADLARRGFVEVHDLKSPAWLGPVLAELDAAGELGIEVRLYAAVEEIAVQHEASRRWGRGRVRLAGAKMFADGTLNSRTALMLEPYAEPLPGMERGKVISTVEQIREGRERTLALGLGLAVHAIGDAAVRGVLDAEEGVQRHGPKTGRGTRSGDIPLRIEHCELIDRADVARFAELGVVASVQPCHLLADIEVLRRRLAHRLERVLPLRELIDAGCEPGVGLIFGSDTPIVRPDPVDSVQAAVNRRRRGMGAAEAIAPEQAISEAEAWGAFSLPGRGA